MRRTIQVKPHEDDRLPDTVLVRGFRKLDLRTGDVEHKILALIGGRQLNCKPAAGLREIPPFVFCAMLFHRDQSVGLGLWDVDISHYASSPRIGTPSAA
jgi:hypothetical protein